MKTKQQFFNLYHHDFVRVAVATPEVQVAQPSVNATRTIALMKAAAKESACLVVFPELGLTGYSCDDLFHQEALLSAAQEALGAVVHASGSIPVTAVVGVPLRHQSHLYNCAAVISGGVILGIVPKTYLPNYREYYEVRHFASSDTLLDTELHLPGLGTIPFGTHLLFEARNQPLFVMALEVCEDLWVPIPPSSLAALAGATVIANPSASNASVGKADYRRQLVANQSARCLSAYVYSAAGLGESTTDLAWDGHGMIADYGDIKAESVRYAATEQLIVADIDLARLQQERMRQNTFADSARHYQPVLLDVTRIAFDLPIPSRALLPLKTPPARFPYVPSNSALRDERCKEVFNIQVQGLVSRLKFTGLKKLVIGVSAGLDSTHALLVAVNALDALALPRKNLLAYTLPGLATSSKTLTLAHALMKALKVSAGEIDIRPSCMQMLKDIGHPFHKGQPVYDITFENIQAGERTSHLFRLANLHGALVVGTSDLSELALGWSTYGVGDHMAHYHVNASVPKTLIQYLIRWLMEHPITPKAVSTILDAVLKSDITPELIPVRGKITQKTQDTVGPYALQDFTLYQVLRFGFAPPRVAFLAWCAWRDVNLGDWPHIPLGERVAYSMADIHKWLAVFLKRFFEDSQFKRSCIANAPKVGSGGSLSPRGDWRAPSDAVADVWLATLEGIPSKAPVTGR